MKVLFIQKVKALVGSEKYFLELIPALEKRGIQTHFICVVNKKDLERSQLFVDSYTGLGMDIEVIEVKSDGSILKTLRSIQKSIQNFNPDIIHSHLIHADFWTAILKKRGKIKCPIVSTKHGYEESYIAKYGFNAAHIKKNRYYRMAKFAEKYIDRSFAVSNGLKELFINSGICSQDKIETIHHGFDLPLLNKFDRDKFRHSEAQLIVVGRIIPFKGHIHLINALPVIKKQIPNIKLVILGHGDPRLIEQLKNRIKELNLTNEIRFEGYQSNIYDYLLSSDVMVVPSIAEGFGLVFLEALNSKLPIVGFDVPATNEIIKNNVNGLLTKPYSESELAENIIQLLSDPKISQSMGEEGHQLLKSYFSLSRMVDETISFYQAALSA